MLSKCFGCKDSKDRVGILLAQLGTPGAPTAGAVRPYLRQFLTDKRVIDTNRFIWWFILNFIVLRTRPKRSAALYKRIWQPQGSPLLLITERQRDRLMEAFAGVDMTIVYGMRYGEPSLTEALDYLIELGCTRLLLFPMYPQYAAATSASTYDVVFQHLLKRRWVPTLRVAEPYYRHPAYLKAQAQIINQALAALPRQPERLVFSYHGIPLRQIQSGDPYCCMCTETSQALVPLINLPAQNIIHTFQSRFGKEEWLTPYTDQTICKLAQQGIKHIAVAAPGFTADCLETLDELGNEGRHAFKERGGEELSLIACLNDHPAWISAMKEIVSAELGSWIASDVAFGARTKGGLNCPLSYNRAI